MPSKAFIFYGSLKDPNRQKAVLNKSPVEVIPGFIRGDLYVVTDHTDPFGVCVYPLAALDEDKPPIAAVLAVFEVGRDEKEKLLRRLQEYEGPLYQMVEAPFIGTDSVLRRGFVFVAKEGATEDPRVQRMAPQEMYDWGA